MSARQIGTLLLFFAILLASSATPGRAEIRHTRIAPAERADMDPHEGDLAIAARHDRPRRTERAVHPRPAVSLDRRVHREELA